MLMFYFTYLTYVLLIKKISEVYIMLYNELHINMLWKKKTELFLPTMNLF